MSKNTYYIIGAIVIVAILIFMTRDTSAPNENLMTRSITVSLSAQNDSGISGTAIITPNDSGKAVVTIAVVGESANIEEPAHIHEGACPTPGAVAYPLNPIMAGSSETLLDVEWDTLVAQATNESLAINLHKSQTEISSYVACGDIEVSNPISSDAQTQ